jgi:hypothetical protein
MVDCEDGEKRNPPVAEHLGRQLQRMADRKSSPMYGGRCFSKLGQPTATNRGCELTDDLLDTRAELSIPFPAFELALAGNAGGLLAAHVVSRIWDINYEHGGAPTRGDEFHRFAIAQVFFHMYLIGRDKRKSPASTSTDCSSFAPK